MLPFPAADEDDIDGELSRQRIASRLFGGPPAMIGRFVIEEPVGAGGMGIVYRARDHELDRDVALKLLRHELPGSEASRREWLYSEARALARLSHPNVVQVYEVGTFKRRVFIAMEYVSGITLDAWRRAQPRSSWRAVYARYLEAGRGLAAAHGVGIVHRDFKPHNALLGDDGRVRVVDFGLAQPVDGDVTSPPSTGETSAPSARGTALAGTPAYMSPEQLKRQPVDARSDQFSFCVAFWEALYGQRPYTSAQLLGSSDAAAPRAAHGGGAPRWLRAVLTRGLALRPAERYTNIDALLTELERRPRALRRRAAASLLSVTVVAGAVLTSQLGAATEPCPREDPQLAALWDAGARARVRAAMEDAAVDVAAALDDYAARWDATRRESCLDAKVRGAQSDARFDRSVACLEVRRAAMAAIIDEFKAPELATTLAAGELLESLPSLAECRDPRYLDATPLVPPDEATARGVDEVRARLRQAENAQLRGSLGEGLALVERARTQAERLGFPPLLAEVSLLHGRLLLAELRVAPGEHALQAAIREADRSGHDDVRWQAQLALGRSALDDREDLSLARERLRDAEATVERLGASTPRRVELRVLEGQLLHAEGQQLRFDERRAAAEQLLDESERILVEAVDAIEPLRDDSPRVYARAAASLADLHADRGDIAAARARYDESFGRHTARDEAVRKFNEAELLVGVGELAAARPLLDEALALDQQHFGPDSPHLAPDYLLLATLEWTAAETAEAAEASEVEVSTSRRKAIQAGERALALYDRHFARDYEERLAALALLSSIYASLASYEDMERVNRAIFDARRETRSLPELWREHNNVGYALIEQGRFVEARNWYQEFRADFDAGPAHALVSIRAYASCGIARALLGLGQLEASLPEFEQALGELDVAAEGDDAIRYGPPNATEREALLAEARWFYAQALRAAGRDLERARALARKARGWYQENDPAAADEIDRFLVKSPN